MKKTLYFLFLILFLVSCKDNPGEPKDTPPEVPQTNTLEVPSNAPLPVTAYATNMNSLLTMGSTWLTTSATVTADFENGAWVWKVDKGGVHAELYATPGLTGVVWELYLDGTAVGTPLSFDDWMAVSGTTSIDGLEGNLLFYNVNSTDVLAKVDWETDTQESQTTTVNATINSVVHTYVYVSNPDTSGSLTAYNNGYKSFEASWGADGSGAYTVYNPQDGTVIDAGSW